VDDERVVALTAVAVDRPVEDREVEDREVEDREVEEKRGMADESQEKGMVVRWVGGRGEK
jgi:hypothetical protein